MSSSSLWRDIPTEIAVKIEEPVKIDAVEMIEGENMENPVKIEAEQVNEGVISQGGQEKEDEMIEYLEKEGEKVEDPVKIDADEEKDGERLVKTEAEEERVGEKIEEAAVKIEEKEGEKLEGPVKIEVEGVKEEGKEKSIEQVEYSPKKEEREFVSDEGIKGPPSGWDTLPPPPPPPPLDPPLEERGQMVCGSCRRLLSYPQGSKHVRCSCCQTVNYVLEEHQVGQLKCGNCAVLLMYRYGAQSIRCCSCRSVIYIGDHNRRPPLSVQQSRACRPFSTAH